MSVWRGQRAVLAEQRGGSRNGRLPSSPDSCALVLEIGDRQRDVVAKYDVLGLPRRPLLGRGVKRVVLYSRGAPAIEGRPAAADPQPGRAVGHGSGLRARLCRVRELRAGATHNEEGHRAGATTSVSMGLDHDWAPRHLLAGELTGAANKPRSSAKATCAVARRVAGATGLSMCRSPTTATSSGERSARARWSGVSRGRLRRTPSRCSRCRPSCAPPA